MPVSPRVFNMLAQKQALKLEMQGLKHSSGRSLYSHIKRAYNLRGNKNSVYTQFCELCEKAKAGDYIP
jgi:hypothetical protein